MKKIKQMLAGILASAMVAVTGLSAFSVSAVSAESETKLIALTFDDGPNTITTNEILDVLGEYHAKASFFLIGDNINAESAVSVKRAYDMGMEIDNHSRTHSNMSEMTPEAMQAEIAYVDKKVTEITGEPTKFFRPPYIDTNDIMYDAIDLPFICGIGCQDFLPDVTAEERADYILDGAADGSILLLHDTSGNSQTVEALKIAVPELKKQGYEFVTLTELFERQGETPRKHILYSQVSKYPCSEYYLYQIINTDTAERIRLDAELLEHLHDSYAIEVTYNSTAYPPVVALQKWSATPPVWNAVQPSYANGETAVFLASDILSTLQETNLNYTELDGITISAYSGEITITDVKLLVTSDAPVSLMGDVNGDGEFTVSDIVMLQKWLLCTGALTNWEMADFTHDGMITIFDLLLMKQELIHNRS